VATIADLGDDDVESYGYQLAREWGISQGAGRQRRPARGTRPHGAHRGATASGVLTDAVSSQIVQSHRPRIPHWRLRRRHPLKSPNHRGAHGDARAAPTRVVHDSVGIFWLLLILYLRGMGGIWRARPCSREMVVGGMRGRRGWFGGGGHGGAARGGGGLVVALRVAIEGHGVDDQ
jgi:uncharacterized membrane protein YgcG